MSVYASMIGGERAFDGIAALMAEMETSYGPPPPDDIVQWGSCRNYPTDVFFPTRGGNTSKGKSICKNDCAVYLECREYALSLPASAHGIWGGLSREERLQILWPGRRARKERAHADAMARHEQRERDRQEKERLAEEAKRLQLTRQQTAARNRALRARRTQERQAQRQAQAIQDRKQRLEDRFTTSIKATDRVEVGVSSGTARKGRVVFFDAWVRVYRTRLVTCRDPDPVGALVKLRDTVPAQYRHLVEAKLAEVQATLDGSAQASLGVQGTLEEVAQATLDNHKQTA